MQISNYNIINKIGEGGMGSVYLAEHKTLGRKVAIKVLLPQYSEKNELKQRFLNEAKVLCQLSHPNIVGIYDLISNSNDLMIIMEYIDGISLDTLIKRKVITYEQNINIFSLILEGMNYAHSNGIVHRDIKPSNIIVQSNLTPKILDFGIAKILQSDNKLTRTDVRLGSMMYMSPEQILGKQIDHRTDIYTLGILLFEILTGKNPYDYKVESDYVLQTDIINKPLPSLKEHNIIKPEYLDMIISKSAAKNTADRFQSCNDLKNALDNTEHYNLNYEHQSIQTINTSTVNSKTRIIDPIVHVPSQKTVHNQSENQFKQKQTNYIKYLLLVVSIISISLIIELYLQNLNLKENKNTSENNKTVKIGGQIWMNENLTVSTFRNGDLIKEIKTDVDWMDAGYAHKPAWCYYNNDIENGIKYGKLYNWYAVNDPRGLAPEGWHIPTDAEWQTLKDFLGGDNIAGGKLKSTNWCSGTNSSGFTALPGGISDERGHFIDVGKYGCFWSSTQGYEFSAWARSVNCLYSNIDRYHGDKRDGLSVRCVKD
jgi:uncharacterized protein (TIGR02145 family)